MSIKLFSPVITARMVAGFTTALGTTVEWSTEAFGMPDLLEGGTLTINLTVNDDPDGMNIAPVFLSVDAAATGFDGEELSTDRWDASDHKVNFVYNWGEPGERFTVPENLTDEHRDRNTAIGPAAGHMYRRGGSYNYYVLGYDGSGNYGWAKGTITVREPDFTIYETVVIDPDGDFSGSPAAAKKLRSLQELNQSLSSDTAERARVLLRRGKKFPITESLKQKAYFIDSFGSGDHPVIDIKESASAVFKNYVNAFIRCSNIGFQGYWDASIDMPTDRSINIASTCYVSFNFTGMADVIFDNCTEVGTTIGHQLGVPGRIIIHEHNRTNCRDYTIIGEHEDMHLYYIGCKDVPTVDAPNGAMDRNQFEHGVGKPSAAYIRNGHQGIRIGFAKTVVISNNDMFARQGWSLQNIFSDNPCIRLMTNTAVVGDKVVKAKIAINRNNIEGTITAVESSGVKIGVLPVSAVFEKNNVIMTATNRKAFQVQCAGWTVRDNKFQSPDLSGTPGNGGPAIGFVHFQLDAKYDAGNVSHPDNFTVPNYVYNNTFVHNGRGEFDDVLFTGHNLTEVANNISYRPNLSNPAITDGPLDKGSVGFEARYRGLRRGFELFRNYHVLASDVQPQATVILPYGLDWYGNVTNAAMFAGHWNRLQIGLNPDNSNQYKLPEKRYSAVLTNESSFSFQQDGIHVTNLSADIWPAGQYVTLMLDRGNAMMDMDTRWATPAGTIAEYGITPQSGAYQDADGLVSMTDFYGRMRPGTGFHGSPAGVPSRGALEPA